MSHTCKLTDYQTKAERDARREMQAARREAHKAMAQLKRTSSVQDLDAFTRAEFKAAQSFQRFKAVIGGEV